MLMIQVRFEVCEILEKPDSLRTMRSPLDIYQGSRWIKRCDLGSPGCEKLPPHCKAQQATN